MFYRLGLVESYGTGIRKIMRLYQDSGLSPVFRTAEGVFSVELQNRNENHGKGEPIQQTGSERAGNTTKALKEEICRLISEKGDTTRKDVEKALHVGSTKAYKLLKQLCDEGRLMQKLNGNRTSYSPA